MRNQNDDPDADRRFNPALDPDDSDDPDDERRLEREIDAWIQGVKGEDNGNSVAT